MKKLLTQRVLSVAALACVSVPAHSEFRYTFFEASYVFGEFESGDSDVDFEGYELIGQYSLSPSFAIGISYSSVDGDDTVTTINGQQDLRFKADGFEAFGFFHTALGSQTDVIFGARIDMSDIEATLQGDSLSASRNDDVNSLFAGFRQGFSGLEFEILWSYNLDAEDDEDEWNYTLGILSGDPTGLQLGFLFAPDDTGDLMGVSIRQSY